MLMGNLNVEPVKFIMVGEFLGGGRSNVDQQGTWFSI